MSGSDSGSDDDGNGSAVLISEREDLFASLTVILNKAKTLTPEVVNAFKPYYERLKPIEEKYEVVLGKLRLFNAKAAPKDKIETSSSYAAFLDVVDTVKGLYLTNMKRVVPEPLPGTSSKDKEDDCNINNSYNYSSLPRIDLPTFSGKIDKFMEFISLFESMIDARPRLTSTEKFHHLKNCLKGDALTVISGLSLEPDNYFLALEALKRRYQNKRRLANAYIEKITSFGGMKNSSQTSLQNFLNVHELNVNALLALGLKDLGDFLLLQLSLNNLDAETRTAFEEKQSTESIPTYADLIKFVTERCRKAELFPQGVGKPAKNNNYSSYSRPNNKVNNVLAPRRAPASTDGPKAGSDSSANYKSKPKSTKDKQEPNCDRQNTNASSGGRAFACWNCGGPHSFSTCELPRKRFCYRCGKQGVSISSCPTCTPGNRKGDQS